MREGERERERERERNVFIMNSAIKLKLPGNVKQGVVKILVQGKG